MTSPSLHACGEGSDESLRLSAARRAMTKLGLRDRAQLVVLA
jgi:hypothetical protein